MTEDSKLILERMIDEAVHKIDFSMEYIYNRCDKLIKLAKEFELFEKAKEIKEIKETEKFKSSPNVEIHPY